MSRIMCILVKNPSHPPLRGDVPPTASRRIARCIATYRQLHRHAVLGTSGAQLLPVWVSWWIEGNAKM
uniref:hypothetical protein n=1 Tax=Prevotella sp. TaxID=59823 RepID=UPI0040299D0C